MKTIYFLGMLLGCLLSTCLTFAQSDSTQKYLLRGVAIKVAPTEYLVNLYPTVTLGTEVLLGKRTGLQAEAGIGHPIINMAGNRNSRTWLYRLEWRKYQRPHFSKTARLYGAVEFVNKYMTEFRTTDVLSGLDKQDYTLQRNVYDLRVKGGIQWMGKLWVLDLFGGVGTRYRDAWLSGIHIYDVPRPRPILSHQPGRLFRLYPALGFKVGWLLFQK